MIVLFVALSNWTTLVTDTNGGVDEAETSLEVSEVNTSSTQVTPETTTTSSAQCQAETQLFFKRATVIYTAVTPPHEQVLDVCFI